MLKQLKIVGQKHTKDMTLEDAELLKYRSTRKLLRVSLNRRSGVAYSRIARIY